MLSGSFARSLVVAASLLPLGLPLAACGPSTPEPVADVQPEPPPTPKKKPKPKCEALSESCAATPDTQAKIAGSDLVFIPPEGWVYAQEGERTLTKPKEGGAILAMASFEGTDNKAREAAFEKLTGALEVQVPEKFKKKYVPTWAKADDTKKSGDLELKLWQAADAKHGTEKGYLLVLLAAEAGGKNVMGVAFSPENDDKSVEAIGKSLETLGPGSYQ